jgi:hypothetical protein
MPEYSETPEPPPIPPAISLAPPPLPPVRRSDARQVLVVFLNVCLALFLADGILSLLDDSLNLGFGVHALALVRGIVAFLAVVAVLFAYLLTGVTLLVPKRIFLPLALFYLVAELLTLPWAIYFWDRMPWLEWTTSLVQVLFGCALLYLTVRRSPRWPWLRAEDLAGPAFSWRNLGGFLVVNIFLLLPGVVAALGFSASAAVHHLSDGFVSLHPRGIYVQVRKYVRNDGKTIQLFPMTHVADGQFFQTVARSFPSNSVVLLEGVTDERHLLTNQISYQRMAKSLGLKEQHENFQPIQGNLVRADVDVDRFSSNTIDVLNLVMLIHTKGVNDQTVAQLTRYVPPPGFPASLLADLVGLRNRQLCAEIQRRLDETDYIVVPWGAAHMPGIAREIEKIGFHLTESRNYPAITFHF